MADPKKEERQRARTLVFEEKLARVRETCKRQSIETTGGITTETYTLEDGRKWLFAYVAENDVANSAKKAETPA